MKFRCVRRMHSPEINYTASVQAQICLMGLKIILLKLLHPHRPGKSQLTLHHLNYVVETKCWSCYFEIISWHWLDMAHCNQVPRKTCGANQLMTESCHRVSFVVIDGSTGCRYDNLVVITTLSLWQPGYYRFVGNIRYLHRKCVYV